MNPPARDYSAKRRFDETPEPQPEVAGDVDPGTARPGGTFVIHQHHARRLHFDLRLEMLNGAVPVLVSWAVPKNLPIEKGVRALAVHVEDHPFEYGSFSGAIPAGNYGAGEVRIFDHGHYELTEQAPGKLTFRLAGRRMQGEWHLVRTGGKSGKDWLAILRSWDRPAAEPVPQGPPMTTGAHREPFDDPDWAFEPLLSGERVWAVCEYRRTNLLLAGMQQLTAPALGRLHERLVALDGVLDGVVVGEADKQSFVVVDLIYLDGRSLVGVSYSHRRELLEQAVVPGDALSVVTSIPGSGRAVADAATRLGLGGAVAKRLDSAYTAGPSADWVQLSSQIPGS